VAAGGALVPEVQFTPDQVGIIKRQICPGASDDELAIFLLHCRRTRLDPFSKQIYAIPVRAQLPNGQWGTKWVPMASVDGLRLVAERTGEYEGQTQPLWCGQDGVWQEVWLKKEPPAAAKVGVYRKGFKEAVWGIATYASFARFNKDGAATGQWRTMPDHMLAKCAETQALRKAFPQELSALETEEEQIAVGRRIDRVTGEIIEGEVISESPAGGNGRAAAPAVGPLPCTVCGKPVPAARVVICQGKGMPVCHPGCEKQATAPTGPEAPAEHADGWTDPDGGETPDPGKLL